MPPDQEVGGGSGGPGRPGASHRFDLSPLISQLCIVDDRPGQPLQRESDFWDSSGSLFSIYSKAAEDEDNKMAERWQKDADGILIFVGPRVPIRLSLHITGIP